MRIRRSAKPTRNDGKPSGSAGRAQYRRGSGRKRAWELQTLGAPLPGALENNARSTAGRISVRFKLQTDYALRAIMFMSAKQGGNSTTDEIAAYFQISSAHLGRVIRRLQNLGLVKAVRGRKGGVRMARDPKNLTVAEVIQTLESNPTPLLRECNATAEQDGCRLEAVLRRGHGLFLNYMGQVNFGDLTKEGMPPASVYAHNNQLVDGDEVAFPDPVMPRLQPAQV